MLRSISVARDFCPIAVARIFVRLGWRIPSSCGSTNLVPLPVFTGTRVVGTTSGQRKHDRGDLGNEPGIIVGNFYGRGVSLIAIVQNYVRLVPNVSPAMLGLRARRSRESGNPGKIAGFLLPQE